MNINLIHRRSVKKSLIISIVLLTVFTCFLLLLSWWSISRFASITKDTSVDINDILKENTHQNTVVIIIAILVFLSFLIIVLCNRIRLLETAFIDKLTGGGTRLWFEKEVTTLLKNSPKNTYAFIILDIDHFKIINDTLGHEQGDKILRNVFNCIVSGLTTGEVAVRDSADNYCILAKFCSESVINDRLSFLFSRINSFEDDDFERDLVVPISAGIYCVPNDLTDMVAIYDRAHVALQKAKKQTGISVRWEFFCEQDREKMLEERRIETRMEIALSANEFKVYFQPKYNPSTKQIEGAEALVRWKTPDRGIIPPDDFISLFERNGFIFNLDIYVFGEVCRTIRKWMNVGIKPMVISVNLSRAYLDRPQFLDNFEAICRKYDVPPEYIEFELTETVVFENMQLLISIINTIHKLGFSCSLDDFGSGYSSLNLLKEVPVDVIKLDRGFFMDKSSDERGNSIIESVVELARKLQLKTVSEGVEQEKQVEFLEQIHCDLIQGFVFSKPVPLVEFEKIAFGKSIIKK